MHSCSLSAPIMYCPAPFHTRPGKSADTARQVAEGAVALGSCRRGCGGRWPCATALGSCWRRHGVCASRACSRRVTRRDACRLLPVGLLTTFHADTQETAMLDDKHSTSPHLSPARAWPAPRTRRQWGPPSPATGRQGRWYRRHREPPGHVGWAEWAGRCAEPTRSFPGLTPRPVLLVMPAGWPGGWPAAAPVAAGAATIAHHPPVRCGSASESSGRRDR